MNLLVFTCHDLGQHLGCYGKPTVDSPRLDRFAGQGVLFEKSFCAAPQCSPSRAALFTGRYPVQNGVMGLAHHPFSWDFNATEIHLAQRLKDAGFRTACVGVKHECMRPWDQCGFDTYRKEAFAKGSVDAGIELLRGFKDGSDAPFYLQIGIIEPHRLKKTGELNQGFLGDHLEPDQSLGVEVPPYLVNDGGARIECAELQGAVKHLDAHFGRLLDALDELGLADNTLVYFAADHGLAFPRAKCSLYDPGIEVATLLRLPSRPGWNGGRRVASMMNNIDFVPTILDLLGLPIPDTIAGRSFAPLLDGGAYEPPDAIFTEKTYHDYYDPMRSVRTGRFKLHLLFSSAPSPANPTQSWRPLSITKIPPDPMSSYHNTIELYDLARDPSEQNNVANDPAYAGVRNDLLARLHRHMVRVNDPLLNGAVPDPQHQRAVTLLGNPLMKTGPDRIISMGVEG